MLAVTTADILAVILISGGVFIIAIWQGRELKIRPLYSVGFAGASLALSFARYRVEMSMPVDAFNYYVQSLLGPRFNIGTEFMPYVTSYLTALLGMGFLPSMMFFAVFGLLAIQLFYKTFVNLVGPYTPLYWHWIFLAVLVPSTGFWGSGIAKESLVLFGIGLFCWGISEQKRHLPLVALGLLLVTLIRPHISIMMLAGLAFGYVAASDTKASERWTIIILSGIVTATVVPLTVNYLGLSDIASWTDVSTRVESFTIGFEGTNAYVNLAEMSLPLKFISYMFRPFPWEAGSISQLAAALQNALLATVFAVTIAPTVRNWASLRTLPHMTYIGFGVIALVMLSLTTANLGISARQKWMVVLPLLLTLISGWSYSYVRHKTEPVRQIRPTPIIR